MLGASWGAWQELVKGRQGSAVRLHLALLLRCAGPQQLGVAAPSHQGAPLLPAPPGDTSQLLSELSRQQAALGSALAWQLQQCLQQHAAAEAAAQRQMMPGQQQHAWGGPLPGPQHLQPPTIEGGMLLGGATTLQQGYGGCTDLEAVLLRLKRLADSL